MDDTLTDPAPVTGSAPSAPSASPEDEPTELHRARAWKRRRAAVRWFGALTLLFVGGLVALGYLGYESSLEVKGGSVSKVIKDPSAPGFVAGVDATPVHLLALTDAGDQLSSLTVVVPGASGADGTVIWSLGELVVAGDGEDESIASIYRKTGLADARAAFEKVLGFGVSDATTIGPDELAAIAAPVGTLTVDNPDPVYVDQKGKRVLRYPAGRIELEPEELGEYATVRGAAEAPENRATRVEALLDALGSALAGGSTGASGSSSSASSSSASSSVASAVSSPSSNVVTDTGVDVSSVIAGLGASDEFMVLPMKRQSFSGSYLYRPDGPAIADELAGVVRFPVSAFPGQRPRVRVLNGTPDITQAKTVAPELAKAGGEILLVGNADHLDAGTTTVVYSDESFAETAQRIADVFRVTARRSEDVSDAADIDVVIGADYQP